MPSLTGLSPIVGPAVVMANGDQNEPAGYISRSGGPEVN